MTSVRQFLNSGIGQGADERIAYYTDTTPWGGSTLNPPSGPVAKVYDVTGGSKQDVTATNMSGAANISGLRIVWPVLFGLIPGKQYRVELSWVMGGQTVEAYGLIMGEE